MMAFADGDKNDKLSIACSSEVKIKSINVGV